LAVTVDPPERSDLAPIAVPLEAARPSARRTRLVVAGWLLGLTAVVALGVSGHEPTPPAPIAPQAANVTVPGPPSPSAAPGPTIRPPVGGPIARHPAPQHRSLGDDGLVGGIVFGDNVPPAD
jgi:hypothetical protein